MTKVYGSGDDNVEVEGDVSGEIGCYGTDESEHGVLMVFDDGTLLEVKYGKAKMAIWAVTLLKAGTLFDRIEPCMDENANPYSDIAYFKDGLKWALAATEWEKVH